MEVQLIYVVIPISASLENGYGLSWDVKYSSLCYPVSPYFLFIPYVVDCIY